VKCRCSASQISASTVARNVTCAGADADVGANASAARIPCLNVGID
jgi:hypothetical protein